MTKKIIKTRKITFLSVFLSALMLPQLAHAEIYKHVDAEGRITYSNVKIKGAKKLQLEPADTNFGNEPSAEKKRSPSTRTATPTSFPKVDEGTQNQRDSKRKDILQSELDGEKKALEEAKKAYAEGASNPEVYQKKNADGSSSTFRNVPKFDEKMKGLQANVDAHQRNIELLEKEMSNIN
jgi:hypothetical protein